MKKSLLTILALLVAVNASAGSLQLSATTRLMSDLRNPTEGTLALEQSGARLGVSLGNNERLSFSADLLARSNDGFYGGVGLVGDRLDDSAFIVESTSDTTTTYRPHDRGKHKGDKHKRKGKKVTVITEHLSVRSIGGLDLGISPSLFLGVSARRGLFAESRVLFNDGSVSNRTSVGIRF